MTPLRYTLIGDGSSDMCLFHVVNWVLSGVEGIRRRGFVHQVADLRYLARPPKTLAERLAVVLRLYPCDLLVIHRDAEREPRDVRAREIAEAAEAATWRCFVPVVPVRMTEAWLLIDERAIRRAASNPNGTQELELPAIARLEDLSDPKTVLHDMLLKASEKRGRRLDQFRKRIPLAVHRVAELITDFGPLRQLDAFRAFEAALVRQAGRFQIGVGDSVSPK